MRRARALCFLILLWISFAPDRARADEGEGVAIRASASAAIGGLESHPIFGGEVGFGAGVYTPHYELYGTAHMLIGSLPFGVEVLRPRVGFAFEGLIGSRVRLGLEVDCGAFFYQRATTGAWPSEFMLGIEAMLSVDLVKTSGDGALFLSLRPGLGVVLASLTNAPLPQLAAGLGMRF